MHFKENNFQVLCKYLILFSKLYDDLTPRDQDKNTILPHVYIRDARICPWARHVAIK